MNKRAISKIVTIILLFMCIHISAQPKQKSSANKEGNEFLNYRGQRLPVESDNFNIQALSTGKYQNQLLIITLYFNQVVNPKSLTSDSIIVQSTESYKVSNISFNKEGTKVQITLNDNIDFPISITLSNVQSYNGKTIPSISIEDIYSSELYKYNMETKQWKKF